MAETQYSVQAQQPVHAVWSFVQDMDNWAHLLTGYQTHQKESETDSLWTLKGDVGVLARTVKFRVHVIEWNGPERVRFTLKGVNEALEGEGELELGTDAGKQAAGPAAPRPDFWKRLVEGIVRFVFRLRHGGAPRAAPTRTASGSTRLTFKLRVDPGGPMAPMINAMMKPAMVVAAEELAHRIVAEIEVRQRVSGA